jgi:hypothetical protein
VVAIVAPATPKLAPPSAVARVKNAQRPLPTPFSGIVERTNRPTPRDGDVNATRSSVVTVTVRGCAAVATTATSASRTPAATDAMRALPAIGGTIRRPLDQANDDRATQSRGLGAVARRATQLRMALTHIGTGE